MDVSGTGAGGDSEVATLSTSEPGASGQRGSRSNDRVACHRIVDWNHERRRIAFSTGALTTTWSRVSGPGTVTFSSPNALNTTASFSVAGTYVLRLSVSDSLLTSTDNTTFVVTQAPVNGLTGQYFNDPGTGAHFVTPILTRGDLTVNFTWTGSPAAAVGADNFSTRWTGRVEAPVTGTYRFTTVSDDGVRLWVNGVQVINNWTDHSSTTNTSAAISLTAGSATRSRSSSTRRRVRRSRSCNGPTRGRRPK